MSDRGRRRIRRRIRRRVVFRRCLGHRTWVVPVGLAVGWERVQGRRLPDDDKTTPGREVEIEALIEDEGR